MSDMVLLTARTHIKVLFPYLLLQLLLIGIHVLIAMFYPHDTGWEWANQWGQLILHSIVAIVELWYVILPFLRWWNTKYEITDYGISNKWGILYKQEQTIAFDHITRVDIDRGILDRIFGCGTLVFHDAASVLGGVQDTPLTEKHGGASLGVRFHDVSHVKDVFDLVQQARAAREQ